MKKFIKKIIKNEDGLTLMELIVVLAIISIIGAILIPNFLNTTDRARIRSDIQSAKVIQNAMDLYQIETGNNLSDSNIETIIDTLITFGYLSERNIGSTVSLQTEGAFLQNVSGNIRIDVSSVSRDVLNGLTDEERSMLINIPS